MGHVVGWRVSVGGAGALWDRTGQDRTACFGFVPLGGPIRAPADPLPSPEELHQPRGAAVCNASFGQDRKLTCK